MADDYYVSQVDGNDAYNGLYPTFQGGSDGPWLTCAKVDGESFIPDDFIKFRRGGVWREKLDINSNGTEGNPITIKDYESGDRPKFWGSAEASGFVLESGNLYYADGYTLEVDMIWFIVGSTITWGDEKTVKGDLANEYDFWWDDGNDRLYVWAPDDPDTEYDSIEATTTQLHGGGINKQHDLKLENLEFSFANVNGLGIWGEDPAIDHAYRIDIIGCHSHHNETHGFKASQDTGTDTVTCYDITFTDCEAYYNGYHGFQFSDGSGTIICVGCISHHNAQNPGDEGAGFRFGETRTGLLQNCESYNNNYGVRIAQWGALNVDDITIEGCDIHDNTGLSDSAGIYILGNVADVVDGIVIRRNMIYNNDDGILGDNDQLTNAEIYYNLIYDNVEEGIQLSGLTAGGSIDIFNNVIANNGGTGLVLGGGVTWKNNIIYGHTTQVSGSGTGDYNCYYPNDYGSKGANSINLDPKFVNIGLKNFHLLSDSPCRNEGVDVSLTPDYDGVSVPQETYPAVGAFEFLLGAVGYSVEAKNAMLDALGGLAVFASLHDGDPGTTGENELSGGDPSYARKAIGWNPATGGIIDSSNQPIFDIPAGKTIKYMGLWSAVTGGTFYLSAPITNEVFANQGIHVLTDGDLDLNA